MATDTDKLIVLPLGEYDHLAADIIDAIAAANGRRRKRTLHPGVHALEIADEIRRESTGVEAHEGGTVGNSYGSPAWKTGLVVAWVRDDESVKIRIIAEEMRAGNRDAQFPVRGLYCGGKLMISPAELIAEAEAILAARDAGTAD
jgi:hypothetical protein